MSETKTVFRRIKGRIVPIKIKIPKDKGHEAAGHLAAGAGFTSLSLAAGKKLKRAEKMHQQAFDFAMDSPRSKLMKKFKDPSSQMIAATKKMKTAGALSKFSKITGAAFIGLGVERLSEKYGLEQHLGTEFASEVAGVSAAIGAESLFRKGAGIGFRKQIKGKKIKVPAGIANPIKGVAKDLASRFIKKQLRLKF